MGVMFSFAPHATAKSQSPIEWERRYGGALSVALMDSESVAGISGPWPDGSFALTWWSTQRFAILPVLEFHLSMEAAKERVEEIADQLGSMNFKNASPTDLSIDTRRSGSAERFEVAKAAARSL